MAGHGNCSLIIKTKPSDYGRNKLSSLGFFFVYLRVNGIVDKAVQTFALTGGKILDHLALALFNDHIDAVIGLFVIPCGGFLLRVIIFGVFQKITSKIY